MKALRFIAGLKQTPQNDVSRYKGDLRAATTYSAWPSSAPLPAAPGAPVAFTSTIVGINSMQLQE
jgi:hypothetical protein